MKKFLVELLQEEVKAIVAMLFGVPALFILVEISEYLWQNGIEPNLDKKFKQKRKAI